MSIEEQLEQENIRLKEIQSKVRSIKEAGLMERLYDALQNLEGLKADVHNLEALAVNQDELTRAVNDLRIQVEGELQARQQQRERENETLAKLNKYLENWL